MMKTLFTGVALALQYSESGVSELYTGDAEVEADPFDHTLCTDANIKFWMNERIDFPYSSNVTGRLLRCPMKAINGTSIYIYKLNSVY